MVIVSSMMYRLHRDYPLVMEGLFKSHSIYQKFRADLEKMRMDIKERSSYLPTFSFYAYKKGDQPERVMEFSWENERPLKRAAIREFLESPKIVGTRVNVRPGNSIGARSIENVIAEIIPSIIKTYSLSVVRDKRNWIPPTVRVDDAVYGDMPIYRLFGDF